MSLTPQQKAVVDFHTNHCETFSECADLHKIFDKQLLTFIKQTLAQQFKGPTLEAVCQRIAPINVLTKIIEKLSPIYNKPPIRAVVGNEQDKELLDFYETNLKPNEYFMKAAINYTLCRTALVQPYLRDKLPRMRTHLSAGEYGPDSGFFVMSDDEYDPMIVTKVVIFFAAKKPGGAKCDTVYFVYTKDTFESFWSDGDSYLSAERKEEDANKNGLGILPYSYATDSLLKVFPHPGTDLKKMTILVPVLISDLNYSVMFQCFSIMYGINLSSENLTMAPNAFWNVKTDSGQEKVELGTLKGEVDYGGIWDTITKEFVMWLDTLGIRVGSVGNVDSGNAANGISKIIDDMDTQELREKLAGVFKKLEEDFWNNRIIPIHNKWVDGSLIDTKLKFSPEAKIEVTFHQQMALTKRIDVIAEQKAELDAKLTTQKRALARLNPEMSDSDLDELLEEINPPVVKEVPPAKVSEDLSNAS